MDDMTNAAFVSKYSEAIRALGGRRRLAEELGVTRQAVEGWRRVPVGHVLRIEALTGISRQDLRPDVYPPE
jgi:DNA-binding transcriptional regulator YdaS (Cro superfamily)